MNMSLATATAPEINADQATIDRMTEILKKQQQAFLEEGPVSAEVRIDRLTRAYKMIAENQDAIIDACNKDFGNRSKHQSRMADVLSVMDGLEISL